MDPRRRWTTAADGLLYWVVVNNTIGCVAVVIPTQIITNRYCTRLCNQNIIIVVVPDAPWLKSSRYTLLVLMFTVCSRAGRTRAATTWMKASPRECTRRPQGAPIHAAPRATHAATPVARSHPCCPAPLRALAIASSPRHPRRARTSRAERQDAPSRLHLLARCLGISTI